MIMVFVSVQHLGPGTGPELAGRRNNASPTVRAPKVVDICGKMVSIWCDLQFRCDLQSPKSIKNIGITEYQQRHKHWNIFGFSTVLFWLWQETHGNFCPASPSFHRGIQTAPKRLWNRLCQEPGLQETLLRSQQLDHHPISTYFYQIWNTELKHWIALRRVTRHIIGITDTSSVFSHNSVSGYVSFSCWEPHQTSVFMTNISI